MKTGLNEPCNLSYYIIRVTLNTEFDTLSLLCLYAQSTHFGSSMFGVLLVYGMDKVFTLSFFSIHALALEHQFKTLKTSRLE